MAPFLDSRDSQDAPNGHYTVPLVIGGATRLCSDPFPIASPSTGKLLHYCSAATETEADDAVSAAAHALKSWKRELPAKRRDILLKVADIMDKRRAELIQVLMEETGSAEDWAAFNVENSLDMIKDVAGRIGSIEGSVVTTADPNYDGMIVKEPYGVVLAMAPWNAAYILGARAIAYPLAAGNTVVFKGSELSPRTFYSLISVFIEAGVPKGALNFLVNRPDPQAASSLTTALIANKHVRKINFTGSTAIGRIISKLAGQYLKPLVLELGGKAPAIVWEDADLDLAATQCAIGSFMYAGQICMSTERIIVHKNVRSAFEEKFVAATTTMFGAQPQTLIQSAAVDKCKGLYQDAIKKGVKVLVGDKDSLAGQNSATALGPVVLTDVKPEMDIFYTESFGPSVSIIEVETEQQAIDIANDTEYGLNSAVFTQDLSRGFRFSKEIESGSVHINRMTVHNESAMPHGGVKASGYGRFNANSLDEWLRTKSVTWKL